ncbi:cytoplasmic thiosulfate:cyanide sulfur transferase [Fimicolochytrium jonesii]|uniref:cytoplasmic thiosulfate:cyanide sulfur transferase n=1 Tax=Fimicolochytrium jonesii TaxID=1396493 RepID=UPI0022FEDBEB|nr:cytoplasmic thiosulfate:cyanide sulfur transferase [Fimicolochytrium jonesii]KAI8823692.1 cytoplasmic thiosulfate:cyanide sulfur transferase [Fimicolochytrium jonesii]
MTAHRLVARASTALSRTSTRSWVDAPVCLRTGSLAKLLGRHKSGLLTAGRGVKSSGRSNFHTTAPNMLASQPKSDGNGTEASSGQYGTGSPLVSTSWLADNLDKVVLLDATWYLQPGPPAAMGPDEQWAYEQSHKKQPVQKDARKEFEERHIKGARFFDLDKVSDQLSSLPHMLPTLEEFEEHVSEMGIKEDDHVVVYDGQGIFSAPRVWWTFKVFGHKNVSVLDGGLPKWLKESRPVESALPQITKTSYKGEFDEELVINYQDLLLHLSDFMYSKNFTILDARPRGRFAGHAPEPRPGLPSGHIPSSINIPAAELVDPTTKQMIPRKEIIRRLFVENVNLDKPIVTMCGSGVTAATLFLALDFIGKKGDVKLYDGSWTEWAAKKDSPVKAWK